jgi:hypothetical protein
VIGGQPGAEHGPSPVGGPGAAGRRRSDDRDRPDFDPDNPWAVEQGGPGVIEPDLDPVTHDPGPGVLGVDR